MERNYLILRDTELELIGKRNYWETKIASEALEAWVDISLKVRSSKNKEIKQFYLERLSKFHTFMQRHDKVVYDFKKLEVEYTSLYNSYTELLDVVNKLKNEF